MGQIQYDRLSHWRLPRWVEASPGEGRKRHGRMLFWRSWINPQEIFRPVETVANGIDMHPQMIGYCLYRIKRLHQHEGFGEMRAAGSVVLNQWGEQFGSKGVELFSKAGILQQAIETKGVDIQKVFSILLTASLLGKRDDVGKRHFQFLERVVTATMNDPEWVDAAVFEQGIAYFRRRLRRLPFQQNDGQPIIEKHEWAFQVVKHNTCGDETLMHCFRGLHSLGWPRKHPQMAMLNRKTQAISFLFDVLLRFPL